MKLQFRQIEPFLKQPDKAARAVLVYGPDQGLVKERAEIIGLTVVPDLNDPFNAAHLTGEVVDADPARFFDEVNAQSLMGGTRLIRVTDAGNKFAVHLKDWLKSNPSDGALVVIESGNLSPRDALRKICEEAPNAAALPCYVPDERDVMTFVRDLATKDGKTLDRDAAAYLAAALKGDRSVARMEMEKLCLYVGAQKNTITLDDARASCGDTGDQSLDDLIYAAFGKDPLRVIRSYNRLLDEGTELMAVQRSLQNHVRRLHLAKLYVEEGQMTTDIALKKLQPPVFFKQEEQFKAQMNRYSGPYLRKLLGRLSEIEAETKRTGSPARVLIGDVLLKMASA